VNDDRTTSQWITENHTSAEYQQWVNDVEDEADLPPDILALRGSPPTVRIVEVSLSDHSGRLSMPDGSTATIGVSLRELRERFGGDEGVLHPPSCEQPVAISLAKWKGRDPDTTFLRISLIQKPIR
jgi:hypothetical protein